LICLSREAIAQPVDGNEENEQEQRAEPDCMPGCGIGATQQSQAQADQNRDHYSLPQPI
jgi:hypothetical protein